MYQYLRWRFASGFLRITCLTLSLFFLNKNKNYRVKYDLTRSIFCFLNFVSNHTHLFYVKMSNKNYSYIEKCK